MLLFAMNGSETKIYSCQSIFLLQIQPLSVQMEIPLLQIYQKVVNLILHQNIGIISHHVYHHHKKGPMLVLVFQVLLKYTVLQILLILQIMEHQCLI